MRHLNIIRNRKEYIIKNLRFDYDKLNDLLYIYKENSNVYSNVIIGEFHLEFDREGNVVGVEILNASDLLKEYEISREFIENIQKVSLRVVVTNNSLLVFIMIYALNKEKPVAITMNSLESPIMQVISAR